MAGEPVSWLLVPLAFAAMFCLGTYAGVRLSARTERRAAR